MNATTQNNNLENTQNTCPQDSAVSVPGLATLRARGTMKWTVYDEDVLPLWVAETDFDTCPAVKQAIQSGVDREYFGYERRNQSVEKALAGFLDRRFGWQIEPTWVRLVPDVVKGVATAIDELTPQGSDVIVPVPSYHPFFDVPSAVKRPKVEVEMTKVKKNGAEEWAFDYAALEAAFASTDNPAGVGAMIVCNPYNPLGRAWRPEELAKLVELAAKYNVRLISDEIHAPVVYAPHKHTPLATLSETAARVTVTVLATSKGWNTAGLHCAQMIFTNPDDRAAMAKVSPLRTGSASTLGQVAAEAAYTDGEAWLDSELEYLEGNLDLLERRLPEVLPGAKFIRPEASFLLWVDLSEVPGLADNPGQKLLEGARVAFNEGTMFGAQGAGHVRINFGTSREILNEALDRIAEFAKEHANN
ncbi:MalY/PatB family protein [Corynebacterium jeikeium]|uniref:cysteine-S-conjugate beta-lyase n=1 Tax=Corynebacterium jeikeium (strain K411) TaxID=306537 RepID=Q4JWQ6_CORJK|nr:aminotransferase class I/II-fold pyridoxal phosphate-dependent enzyme [Corynebacterium jeikeium]EEW16825.1 aminotransferase, class I/II [Corynebacterium jeikeium ATCC 43734]OOD30207.1 cystathionine beta-lyase [Corynebacterium jeikeium]WCZ53148.1 Cystathionine beta-lyase PatB [Corynebacterium jeikeium]CAI36751.1 cystathionine beta-lyase [Corynebacterium jeikeium K411]SUY81542.1 cystathionine beta-lyase [Corynebacterium jeikeium]